MNFDLTKNKELDTMFRRTEKEEKARQILEDIKNKKIQLRPTTDTHIIICKNFKELIRRCDRLHLLTPYMIRDILALYEKAEFYGLIEKSESMKIVEKDHTINEKDKEILKLKKQLAKYEGNDKPDDAVYSDVLEEND